MLKILENFFVKKTEYENLLKAYSDLTSICQDKELAIHSLKSKLLAKEDELKDADETIKILKKAIYDLTLDLNNELSSDENKKKEEKNNGTKEENNTTKTVSKRGRPRKSKTT